MNRNRFDRKKNDKKEFFFFIYRSITDPVPKQSSITSISSNVPLMATSNHDDTHYSTQLSTNTTTDTQSFINSFKTNTSMKTNKRIFDESFFFCIYRS